MTASTPQLLSATSASRADTASKAKGRVLSSASRPLALHAALIFAGAFILTVSDDPVFTLRVVGALAFFVYVAIAVIEARRAPLLFSPLSFYFAWYSIGLGPATIHHANIVADGSPIYFGPRSIDAADLAAGYLLYLLGSFCLHLGLQLTRPVVAPGERAPVSGSGFVLLWVVGVVVRLFAERLGVLGALGGVLQWGALAALIAFVATERENKQRDHRYWLILVGGTLVLFVLHLRTGSKAFIMFSFLPAALLFVKDNKLRRWLPALAIAGITFYLTLVAPVVSASREASGNAGETTSDRIVRTYVQNEYSADTAVGDQVGAFLERIFEPTPAAFLYSETERTGLMWGETMQYLAYAFVPRLFWPDKPGVSRGGWFYAYIGAARSEAEAATSIAQTAVGELYWNFGYLGVVLGLGGLGAALGLLWRLATAFPHRDPVRILLYVSVTFNMLDMSEAGTAFVGVTFRAIILVPTIFLLDRVARQQARLGRAT